MGQAKMGELERAARLGAQFRPVRDHGIKPGDVGDLLAARLIAEQEHRQAQTEREAEDKLRRELADALVASVHEVWFQEPKHAVSDAIDARWAPEVRQAKREAWQLADALTGCGRGSAGTRRLLRGGPLPDWPAPAADIGDDGGQVRDP
jgi:hypothetical protein